MNRKMQRAAEMRAALQMFIRHLDPETELEDILEIPTVFPAWAIGKAYKIKDVFSYGKNGVGDPQLYQVLLDHTAMEEHPPDTTVGLYKAIGVDPGSGYPEWVQPLGSTDAYELGDIVSHNGELWISVFDGANVWEPGVFGWEVYHA